VHSHLIILVNVTVPLTKIAINPNNARSGYSGALTPIWISRQVRQKEMHLFVARCRDSTKTNTQRSKRCIQESNVTIDNDTFHKLVAYFFPRTGHRLIFYILHPGQRRSAWTPELCTLRTVHLQKKEKNHDSASGTHAPFTPSNDKASKKTGTIAPDSKAR
jgi:hypothetical protein